MGDTALGDAMVEDRDNDVQEVRPRSNTVFGYKIVPRVVTAMLRLISLIRDLLLPRGCAGCDKPDTVVCSQCAMQLKGLHQFSVPHVTYGGIACGWYRGEVRRAVLAWKDHGDEECDVLFAQAITDAMMTLPIFSADTECSSIALVPAPSSRRSMYRRGRWHTLALTRHVAARLRDRGADVRVAPILDCEGVAVKSVQMQSAAQRSSRLDGRIRVKRDTLARGSAVMVIDDIVTSGATIRHCVDALRDAGHPVLAVATLAWTPAPGEIIEDDDMATA